jgi:hypothetical protein
VNDAEEKQSIEPDDLKPKKPSNRAPQGIRTFTVCRQSDETGISGEAYQARALLLKGLLSLQDIP